MREQNKGVNEKIAKSLSIVIPAFNEEDGIGEVIDDLKQVIRPEIASLEIIVVNDGSTDNTADIVKSKDVILIENPCNIGYGASLKRGIEKSKFEFIAIIDADGTYAAGDLLKLAQYIDKGFDMVVGIRQNIYLPSLFIKQPARFIFKIISEYVAGCKIPDINSGLRIFRRNSVMNFLEDACMGFSFTTSITLIVLLEKYFVKYVPIEYHRRKGKSKVRYFRDSLRTLEILTRTILKYNPLKLFLLLSSFTSLIFLVNFIFYIISKNQIVGLYSLLSIFLSVIILSFGFIAELLKQK